MKKKKRKKIIRKRVEPEHLLLLPFDWNVILDALNRKADHQRERFFHDARFPGAEEKHWQEQEYLSRLIGKVQTLSMRHLPEVKSFKMPRFL